MFTSESRNDKATIGVQKNTPTDRLIQGTIAL